ncbi:hypothetical protein [Candidatus Ichthyocystis hellenicum]|uniref:hypothetical protein n=1 Tax=Candidatus Ichthyocystis hellenicum TaxID=1561003 RepID=UPI000B860427|nr:hypothetical protein [Candidatus Ichthyocystis hellenicum]
MCTAIVEIPQEVNELLITNAFEDGSSILRGQGKANAFNFSFPLHLPRVASGNDRTGSDLITQLSGIGSFIRGYLSDYADDVGGFDLSNPFYDAKLCDDDHNPNLSIFVRFCNSTRDYIDYPFTQSATEGSDDLKTTVSNFMSSAITESTTTESEITTIGLTSLIPTKITPASTNINTLNIVLISFLFIAFAIIAFLGYRSCKNNKSRQPISQTDNANAEEELEDLV